MSDKLNKAVSPPLRVDQLLALADAMKSTGAATVRDLPAETLTAILGEEPSDKEPDAD
jgi:hypothetical protein